MSQKTKNNNQSRLEQEGIQIRKETIIKNEFNGKNNVYDEQSEKAKSHNDELHPHGKGTGHGGHTHLVPNKNTSKTSIDRSQIDTENGGGSYDIFGRENSGGRNRSKMINLYNSGYQYNEDSIDTSKNIEDGQWSNNS